MIEFRRSRSRRHPDAREAAPTQDPSATAAASWSDSRHGLGWAVLGVAIVLGLFLLVPFGLERSSAIIPATSTGPASTTSGPQTWVLSSTVAAPGPVTAEDAERKSGHRRPGTSTDGSDLIIRVPVPSPTSLSKTTVPTGDSSADPASTAQLPSAITPTSGSPCPQPSAGDAPSIDVPPGGDLGSTADAGTGTAAETTTGGTTGGTGVGITTGAGAPCPG